MKFWMSSIKRDLRDHKKIVLLCFGVIWGDMEKSMNIKTHMLRENA